MQARTVFGERIWQFFFLSFFLSFLSLKHIPGSRASLPRRGLQQVTSWLLLSQTPKFWGHQFPGELINYTAQKNKKEQYSQKQEGTVLSSAGADRQSPGMKAEGRRESIGRGHICMRFPTCSVERQLTQYYSRFSYPKSDMRQLRATKPKWLVRTETKWWNITFLPHICTRYPEWLCAGQSGCQPGIIAHPEEVQVLEETPKAARFHSFPSPSRQNGNSVRN